MKTSPTNVLKLLNIVLYYKKINNN